MQELKLYEYAVLRLVPRVEREEFFNVGLILFSKKEKYIRVAFEICPRKLDALGCEVEIEALQEHLESLRSIALGTFTGHPVSAMEIQERFRWLTAVRSAMIQTSRPHPGKAMDLNKAFECLYKEFVLSLKS